MQDHLIVPVGVSVAVGFLSLDRSRPGRLFVADETSAIWVIQDVFHPDAKLELWAGRTGALVQEPESGKCIPSLASNFVTKLVLLSSLPVDPEE
eukprot:scaffold17932_cov16-Tisochrysis_lutea.AAC.1